MLFFRHKSRSIFTVHLSVDQYYTSSCFFFFFFNVVVNVQFTVSLLLLFCGGRETKDKNLKMNIRKFNLKKNYDNREKYISGEISTTTLIHIRVLDR